jgi:WD40 repeat protein
MAKSIVTFALILGLATGSASGGAAKAPQGQDYEKFVKVKELTDYPGDVRSLEWMPDSKTLIVAGRTPAIWLWSTQSGEVTAKLNIEPAFEMSTLDLSADGKVLAAIDPYKVVQIWDVPGRRLSQTYNFNANPYIKCIDLSPDGTRLASLDNTKGIAVINLKNGSVAYTLDASEHVRWSAGGKKIMIFRGGYMVSLWDGNTGKFIERFTNESTSPIDIFETYVFSPDDKLYVVSGEVMTGTYKILAIDVRTGLPVKEIIKASTKVWPLGFSKDGKYLLLQSSNIVSVCNMATRKLVNVWTAQTSVPESMMIAKMSDDGRSIAVTEQNKVIILAENPEPRAEVK